MRKIIITIFITLIFVIIAGGYAIGIIYAMTEDGAPAFLVPLAVIIFIGIIGVLIYNMNDRIQEIRRGDENDISKY
jgi:xanthosine utilization system XapX-like protein